MLHLSLPVGVLGNKRPPVQPLQGSPDVIVPNSVGSVHRGHCQEDFVFREYGITFTSIHLTVEMPLF